MVEANATRGSLAILHGGVDPAELVKLEHEAARAIAALADALPATDDLYEAVGLMAVALKLRQTRRRA